MSIIWQAIQNFRELSDKLDIKSKLLENLIKKQTKLYSLKPGRSGLMGWREDYDDADVSGHFSPLYGLYPGDRIKYHDSKKFALVEACADYIGKRIRGDEYPSGFSAAWAISLYARLHRGERAYSALKKTFERFTFPNLLNKNPPNFFQIDGNLGVVSGINEMLAQCEDGIIELLPALPEAFSEGSVSGLVVKGGYAVDMEWRNKKVVRYEIKTPDGNNAEVKIR
jgi:alpha-L-fucosidase 2